MYDEGPFNTLDRLSDQSIRRWAEEAEMLTQSNRAQGKHGAVLFLAVLVAILILLFVFHAIEGDPDQRGKPAEYLNEVGHGAIERIDSTKSKLLKFFTQPELGEGLDNDSPRPSPFPVENRKPVTIS